MRDGADPWRRRAHRGRRRLDRREPRPPARAGGGARAAHAGAAPGPQGPLPRAQPRPAPRERRPGRLSRRRRLPEPRLPGQAGQRPRTHGCGHRLLRLAERRRGCARHHALCAARLCGARHRGRVPARLPLADPRCPRAPRRPRCGRRLLGALLLGDGLRSVAAPLRPHAEDRARARGDGLLPLARRRADLEDALEAGPRRPARAARLRRRAPGARRPPARRPPGRADRRLPSARGLPRVLAARARRRPDAAARGPARRRLGSEGSEVHPAGLAARPALPPPRRARREHRMRAAAQPARQHGVYRNTRTPATLPPESLLSARTR